MPLLSRPDQKIPSPHYELMDLLQDMPKTDMLASLVFTIVEQEIPNYNLAC